MDNQTVSLKDWGAIEPFAGLSVRFLKDNRCLPLKKEDGRVLLAMADPDDQDANQAMEVALGAPVHTQINLAEVVNIDHRARCGFRSLSALRGRGLG